jgi:hypothetical protein
MFYTLFQMCMLKHTKQYALTLLILLLGYRPGFHPSNRPFAPCFKCRARISFPHIHTN